MEFTDYDKVVEWLAADRAERRIPITEVGRQMGVQHSSVWRIEQRKRTPGFKLLQSYAAALGHELVLDVRQPMIPLERNQ